jgi:uncharacterized membrane protein
MTALDQAAPRRLLSSSYLRRALFVVLGLLTLVALYAFDLPLLAPNSPDMARLMSYGFWLPVHAVFGTAALLIGPFQFSATLRARNPRLHRRLGQTYVASVTIAGIMALVIDARFETFGLTQIAAQAVTWLICTHAAWFAARNRNVMQHRLWIARSYGLTFIFVSSRAILGIFFVGADNWTVNDVLWALTVAAFVIPDLMLSGRAIWPGRTLVKAG